MTRDMERFVEELHDLFQELDDVLTIYWDEARGPVVWNAKGELWRVHEMIERKIKQYLRDKTRWAGPTGWTR